jgi:ribosomal protein L5
LRSFEGLSRRGADDGGNFNFGIEDHAAFLEVQNLVDFRCGFDVMISTTASCNKGVLTMIEALGFPLTDARKTKKGKKGRKR